MLTIFTLPVMAYTIDGSVSDWGVNLSKAYDEDYTKSYSGVNGWIPNGHSNVDYVIENNIDPSFSNPYDTGSSGFITTGTHIQKTGSMSSPASFVEQIIHCNYNNKDYQQPAGGEPYDLEAVYFDDDNTNMYLAIVTSISPTTTSWKLGDIALDINRNDGKSGDAAYEYGIVTLANGSNNAGTILKNPIWSDPDPKEFTDNGPFTCSGGTVVGTGTLVYNQVSGAQEKVIKKTAAGNTTVLTDNYVVEVRIPKSAIGYPTAGQMSNLHLTIGCGNDLIELTPVQFKTNIPEFPTIVLPVAAIMGLMLIFGRRNKE
jgi:hypothetical protein